MAESSRSAQWTNGQRAIVVIDDDDVAMPSASTYAAGRQAHSPAGSLNNLTPAMSVTTSSNSSDDRDLVGMTNGIGLGAREEASGALDEFRTGYVYSSEMMLHSNPIDPEHPERPVRIYKIFRKLQENSLLQHMKRIKIREVTKDEVMLVHDQGIWDGVERTALYHPDIIKEQVPRLENLSSLYINEHSAFAARLSCGGAIELCDAIASGRIRNGFAIVRPPGHHAEPNKSMGFCFYNNVAVATRYLQQKYPQTIRKILILDWDVHHGNGTQRAFENDAEVLYVSLHRYEGGAFYPGSKYGNYDSAGTGPGEGKSVNVPWPTKGMGDADYMYAFHHLVMPIALEFAPDFVIISAGFDAAEGDPIGESRVTPGGYAQMTHALTSLCDGKVAVVLEGGYNPDAVADSAHAVTEVILARRTVEPKETVASTIAANTVREVCRFHQRYWKSLKVPDLEADDVDFDTHDAPPSVCIEDLLSEYRNSVLSDRFDLFEVPLPEADVHFSGQVLCSEGILERFATVVFFVHDMGNLRSGRPRLDSTIEGEAMRLVDASSLVMSYVRDKAYGLVDMNIMREFRAVKPHAHDAMPRAALSDDTDRIAEANEAAAFVWDNIVSLARASTATKIVMIGFGTGCDVLTSLIQARDVETQVKAVVNIVGYNEMPRIDPTAELAKKKWYYTKSKVLAPADHRHILERGDSVPLKRFGKITPVGKSTPPQITLMQDQNPNPLPLLTSSRPHDQTTWLPSTSSATALAKSQASSKRSSTCHPDLPRNLFTIDTISLSTLGPLAEQLVRRKTNVEIAGKTRRTARSAAAVLTA
jgi:histone deacetylase 6